MQTDQIFDGDKKITITPPSEEGARILADAEKALEQIGLTEEQMKNIQGNDPPEYTAAMKHFHHLGSLADTALKNIENATASNKIDNQAKNS